MLRNIIPMLAFMIFLFATVSAFPSNMSINTQPTDANNSILPGQTFVFNTTLSANTDCSSPVYSDEQSLTTDSRGILHYLLPNVASVDFSAADYRFCYRRDGVLEINEPLGVVPYAYYTRNSSWAGIIGIPSDIADGDNDTIYSHLSNFTDDVTFTLVFNTTGDSRWIPFTNESSLNTNSSSFWDNLNSPSDITGLADSQISDTLTVDATGSVTWSALVSYPSACSTSETLTTLGDTVTCSSISILESQISDLVHTPLTNIAFLNETQTFTKVNTFTGDVILHGGQLLINNSFNDKIILNGTQSAPHTILSRGNQGVRFYSDVLGQAMSTITNDGNITSPGRATFGSLNVTGPSYLGDLIIEADNITTSNILPIGGTGGITFWDNLDLQNIYNVTNVDWFFGKINHSDVQNFPSFILSSAEGNLNTNSSGFWDNLDTPADITGLTESQISDLTHTPATADGSLNSTSFNQSGSNVVLRDTSNNVGIGTVTPSQKLEVAGNVNISAGNLSISNGANTFSFTINSAGQLVIGRS